MGESKRRMCVSVDKELWRKKELAERERRKGRAIGVFEISSSWTKLKSLTFCFEEGCKERRKEDVWISGNKRRECRSRVKEMATGRTMREEEKRRE